MIWHAENQTQVGYVKVKCLTHSSVSVALSFIYIYTRVGKALDFYIYIEEQVYVEEHVTPSKI